MPWQPGDEGVAVPPFVLRSLSAFGSLRSVNCALNCYNKRVDLGMQGLRWQLGDEGLAVHPFIMCIMRGHAVQCRPLNFIHRMWIIAAMCRVHHVHVTVLHVHCDLAVQPWLPKHSCPVPCLPVPCPCGASWITGKVSRGERGRQSIRRQYIERES